MNELERRYRRALRLLPAAYRQRWEEEMVEAYLASVETDDADRAEFFADFGRPSWSEVRSVLLLSVRLRLGLAGTPTPRSIVWGDAFRTVALSWLLAAAVMATVGSAVHLWSLGLLGWLPAPPSPTLPLPASPASFVWQFAPVLWTAAFAALLFGRVRVARGLAVLLVLRHTLWYVVEAVNTVALGAPAQLQYGLPYLLLEVGLLVTLWTFVPPVTVGRRPWALAFVAGVVIASAIAILPTDITPLWAVIDQAGLYTLLLGPAALVHLARRHRDPSWSLALAVLVGIVLVLRVVTLPPVLETAAVVGHGLTIAVAVEVVALALLTVALVRVGVRALARLRPDHPVLSGDPSPT